MRTGSARLPTDTEKVEHGHRERPRRRASLELRQPVRARGERDRAQSQRHVAQALIAAGQ
jgi:hypothetical protein